ncbi:hypothetical protein IAD21_00341 [Abditibacteriota bacterium]|nr:hypothetical protein IAD21_00341 [Abditibacteriota bacterium]
MKVLNFSAIPILAEVDILVVGAGSAGCCAALAARESGQFSVLLAERYGFAGGSSTGVLTTFYGFFTPGDAPRKVVGGVPDRVVNELEKRRAMYLRPNTYGAGTGVTYNPETLKLVWDEMLARTGVQVWFGCQLVDVESDANGPTHAIFWSKSGFFKVAAKRFIDASGDADFCEHAGFTSEKAGDLDPAQTLTTTFRMSNVDWSEFDASGGKKMLMERMSDAVDAGFPLPRKAGSAHLLPMQGVISTIAVRVADVNALDFQDLSRAEIEGRRQAFIYEQFFRERVTGFENSDIVSLSVGIGVRETRRVYGEYRLTRDDCFAVKRFDDKVLLCGAPIEDHRASKNGEEETVWGYIPGNDAYDVPYRTLVPRGSNTVWVVGRCFSATHDAHASCRSMGQTMSMGQAAGLAAVLSLETDVCAREIDISNLQNRLRDLGAVLETPDHVAAIAARAWRENFDHLVI